LRELLVNQLKSELKNFQGELEKLENEISIFSNELAEEKKIKKLARIIYAEEFNEDRRKIYETI